MELKITTEHSVNRSKDTQEINLKLLGGSPYFGYLWIDDVLYTMFKGSRTITLKKTK